MGGGGQRYVPLPSGVTPRTVASFCTTDVSTESGEIGTQTLEGCVTFRGLLYIHNYVLSSASQAAGL